MDHCLRQQTVLRVWVYMGRASRCIRSRETPSTMDDAKPFRSLRKDKTGDGDLSVPGWMDLILTVHLISELSFLLRRPAFANSKKVALWQVGRRSTVQCASVEALNGSH